MICTVRDDHIRKLIMEDISMTWKCTLDDGRIESVCGLLRV